MKTRSLAAVALSLALVTTAHASANDNSWIDSNGKWENSNNWSLGVAPSSSDNIDLITNAGNNTVTIDVTTTNSPARMTVSNLTINSNTLRLSNTLATTFHVLNALSLNTNATLLVNNSAVLVDGSLGVGAFGSGNQLIITNGGQVFSPATTIGGVPGFSNSVVITGPGSVLVNTNTINIRNSAAGTAVTVANGGKANVNNVFLGNSATANGNIVLVTDAGSTWSNTGTLNIGGSSASAQFIVSNGASAYSSIATIGSPGGANHSALVTGSNSVWSSDIRIVIGNGGSSNSLSIQNGGAVFVTNTSHTAQVTVDAATLILGAGTFKSDNLVVTNGGGVQYNLTYQVDNGTVTVAGGSLQAGSNLFIAATTGATGTMIVVAGTLVATNGVFGIGNNGTITGGGGVGRLTVSNGTLLTTTILLGSSTSNQSDLIVGTGGTISCAAGSNCLMVINSLGADNFGIVDMPDGTKEVGVTQPADYNIEAGAVDNFADVYVGYGDTGTMTIAGGVANISSRLIVGYIGSPVVANGTVWVTGGQVTVNGDTFIGNDGIGQLTISGSAVMSATKVTVANSGNPGALAVAGGTLNVYDTLTVGDCNAGHVGAVTITSGNLFVTNAAHNATLDVRNGSLALNGGTLTVDRLVMTNTCGLFISGGGILNAAGLMLDPNLDADGDGMPNGWEQRSGLNPLNAADATADEDGDGLSNLREFQLGTDPANPWSPNHITAIARVGNDVRVTWMTVGGSTNRVQVSTGATGGRYDATTFSDLSSPLNVVGSTVTSTNYLDLGGATSSPARYYRIRIVP